MELTVSFFFAKKIGGHKVYRIDSIIEEKGRSFIVIVFATEFKTAHLCFPLITTIYKMTTVFFKKKYATPWR